MAICTNSPDCGSGTQLHILQDTTKPLQEVLVYLGNASQLNLQLMKDVDFPPFCLENTLLWSQKSV